jgi:hypothetical protein
MLGGMAFGRLGHIFELISKMFFRPNSALRPHINFSKYYEYDCGLIFVRALISTENPIFEITSPKSHSAWPWIQARSAAGLLWSSQCVAALSVRHRWF